MIVPAMGQQTRPIYGPKTEQVTRADGGTSTITRNVETGAEHFVYEVHLDRQALAALVEKAASNKTGRSRSGPITVKIVTRGKNETNTPNL